MSREKLSEPNEVVRRRGFPEDHYYTAQYDLRYWCEVCGRNIKKGERYRRRGWTDGQWNGALGVRHRMHEHEACAPESEAARNGRRG